MPRFARSFRALAVVLAAALTLLVGPPGMAAANGGHPQGKPEEWAAALIRPSVTLLAGESYGLVRLPAPPTCTTGKD